MTRVSPRYIIEILQCSVIEYFCSLKKANFICILTSGRELVIQTGPLQPCIKKCWETEMRFFNVKRLCTIRLEPLCLDSAFPVRAAKVRKLTVKRYNYSQQDANFRCAVRKG